MRALNDDLSGVLTDLVKLSSNLSSMLRCRTGFFDGHVRCISQIQ